MKITYNKSLIEQMEASQRAQEAFIGSLSGSFLNGMQHLTTNNLTK